MHNFVAIQTQTIWHHSGVSVLIHDDCLTNQRSTLWIPGQVHRRSLEVGNIKMIICVYKVEGYGINFQIIYAPRAPLSHFGLGWQEDAHCLSSSGDLEVLSILVPVFLSSVLALYPMLAIEMLSSEVKKRIHVKEYLWSKDILPWLVQHD